jgi:perosamine synthetase
MDGNEKAYVTECLDTGWVSSKGQFVERFESMFSSLHHDLFSVSTSNGTTALHLALLALGIGKGDEVIVPNLTFVATVNAVLYCDATPILIDVDARSWNITAQIIEPLITSRTKAIIPVHLFGQPCDMCELQKLADKHNLLLIEDSAEALGSTYQGYPVGTFGDASIFSFFGNKTITTGEGGMVLFKDDQVAAKARILRDHGMKPGQRYWHEMVGYNYRLTNVQAAIGVAQLEKLTQLVKAKQIVASRYNDSFVDLNIQAQEQLTDSTSSSWLCGFLLKDRMERDSLISYLTNKGIETRIFFYPIHILPPYQELRRSSSLRSSEELALRGICLPSSASLSVSEQNYVIEQMISGLGEIRKTV